LVLQHKDNKLRSIHRNIKSQDDLKVYYEPKIRWNWKKLMQGKRKQRGK